MERKLYPIILSEGTLPLSHTKVKIVLIFRNVNIYGGNPIYIWFVDSRSYILSFITEFTILSFWVWRNFTRTVELLVSICVGTNQDTFSS